MKRPDIENPADVETVEGCDEVIETLDAAIKEATRKVESGRVKSESKEEIRIEWVKALVYLVRTKRLLLKDRAAAADE